MGEIIFLAIRINRKFAKYFCFISHPLLLQQQILIEIDMTISQIEMFDRL